MAAKGGSGTCLPHSNQPPAQYKTSKSVFQTSADGHRLCTSGPTPETQPAKVPSSPGAARAGAPARTEMREPWEQSWLTQQQEPARYSPPGA